ncbi:creatininase family protein [uncultured Microbacterium sp.]|uniref:creatininase family protein n=1 Tax=uncultured Microbacterium sp. TaxID=191216 RepID=UPI0035CB7704
MRRLEDVPGPALEDVLTDESVLVMATGAIEHHGPHLPLATDSIMAVAVAEAAVSRAVERGVDAWLLPALRYGSSVEHTWAPGTLSLSNATVLAILGDLGQGIARTRARKLVFLNGHGGNVAVLQIALRDLRRRFGLQTFFTAFDVPPGDGIEGPDESGMAIHGGHSETSLMLHLRPDLVDLSRAQRHVPDQLRSFERIGFARTPVTLGWVSNDFDDSGVIGDPTGANAEWGAALFERAVEGGALSLAEIARFAYRADTDSRMPA